jgi:hypothetical protein
VLVVVHRSSLTQASPQPSPEFFDEAGDGLVSNGIAQGAFSILQKNPEGKALFFY